MSQLGIHARREMGAGDTPAERRNGELTGFSSMAKFKSNIQDAGRAIRDAVESMLG